MAIYKLTVLIFLSLWASAIEHIVYPKGERCTAPPCLSLEDYLRNVSQYFTDHSYFQFFPGNHYLNSTLSLENLANVTLSGTEGKTKLWISEVFTCENFQSLTFNGLDIWYDGVDRDTQFNLSHSSGVLLSNTQFNNFTGMLLDKSDGAIHNCSFLLTTVHIENNSTIIFYDVTFRGDITFGVSTSLSNIEFRNTLLMSDGKFALFAAFSLVTFKGNASFENNFRAIKLYKSRLIITGFLLCKNNSGTYGAGLLLDEQSSLVLRGPVEMYFLNNSVDTNGGAIMILDTPITYFKLCENDVPSDFSCFFEIESDYSYFNDVHLEFLNNTALMGGSAIYGGVLTKCRVKINDVLQDWKGYEILRQISTISSNQTISSDPLQLCVCSEICVTSSFIDVIPGESFNVSLTAMGQVNTTTAEIGVKGITSAGLQVVLKSITTLVAGCNEVTFQIFSDLSDTYVQFRVFPYDCSEGDVVIYLIIHKCPNGFILNEGICVCEKVLQSLPDISCNVQTRLLENSGTYWITPSFKNSTYNEVIWSQFCPNGYCKKTTKGHPVEIDFSFPNGSNSQCAENRSGTLCGACATGYSLSLSTLECKKCENKTVSLILLFAVAGVGLIAVLSCLNMTVASGTLNGLILYVNIVNVHRDVFFKRDTESSAVNPLQVFISWLNLDFGIPLCFYDGLNAYQYYWLQYAFPVYLWFLTGLIIIGSKYSRQLRRLLGSNPVAVLATIILMSFNKCLQASVEALAFVDVQTSEGPYSKVWLYDGNLAYFEDWRHIILAAGAICVLVFFLLPFVLLLIFGSTLQAYSDRTLFRWFNRFTPFLDAYYAPFNKNSRYWPGLMLVLRIGLFLSYMISSDNLMVIVCTIFTATIALQWKVFKNFYLDLLQASFALNLCVLCVGKYHVQQYDGNQFVLSSICTVVALIQFVGILVFHICIRLNCMKVILKMPFWYKIQRYRLRNDVSEQEVKPVLEDSNSINFREPLLSTRSSIMIN